MLLLSRLMLEIHLRNCLPEVHWKSILFRSSVLVTGHVFTSKMGGKLSPPTVIGSSIMTCRFEQWLAMWKTSPPVDLQRVCREKCQKCLQNTWCTSRKELQAEKKQQQQHFFNLDILFTFGIYTGDIQKASNLKDSHFQAVIDCSQKKILRQLVTSQGTGSCEGSWWDKPTSRFSSKLHVESTVPEVPETNSAGFFRKKGCSFWASGPLGHYPLPAIGFCSDNWSVENFNVALYFKMIWSSGVPTKSTDHNWTNAWRHPLGPSCCVIQ